MHKGSVVDGFSAICYAAFVHAAERFHHVFEPCPLFGNAAPRRQKCA